MRLFNTDSIWDEYKSIYDDINKTKDLGYIDELEKRADELSYKLIKKNPESNELINEIIYILHDELRRIYSNLQKIALKDRKYREPDYLKDAASLNKRIKAEISIINILIDESNKDTWVISTFYKGIQVSIELIEAKIMLHESKVKNNSMKISKDTIAFLNEVNSNLSNAYILLNKVDNID